MFQIWKSTQGSIGDYNLPVYICCSLSWVMPSTEYLSAKFLPSYRRICWKHWEACDWEHLSFLESPVAEGHLGGGDKCCPKLWVSWDRPHLTYRNSFSLPSLDFSPGGWSSLIVVQLSFSRGIAGFPFITIIFFFLYDKTMVFS